MEANPASPDTSPKTNVEDLFAEITTISSTLNKVANDVSIIKPDMTELKNTVSTLQIRLAEAENRIANVEDSPASMANDNKLLSQ